MDVAAQPIEVIMIVTISRGDIVFFLFMWCVTCVIVFIITNCDVLFFSRKEPKESNFSNYPDE